MTDSGMEFSAKQYAQALHEAVSETKPQEQEKILDNFAQILKHNGDLSKIDEIEKEFLSLRGIRQVQITSTRAFSEAEEKRIISELNEYVGAKVELRKKVDEGLLGGVVIKVDDELIDGSVRMSLKDLKNKLINEST